MGIFKAICSLFGGKTGPTSGSGVGIVKWFSHSKGYGFIQPEDGSPDVFVHISSVQKAGFRSLNKGQRVAYELETKKGRISAINLKNPR